MMKEKRKYTKPRTLNKQERILFELEEREREILQYQSKLRAYEFYIKLGEK